MRIKLHFLFRPLEISDTEMPRRIGPAGRYFYDADLPEDCHYGIEIWWENRAGLREVAYYPMVRRNS